jgi:hypothetical protein
MNASAPSTSNWGTDLKNVCGGDSILCINYGSGVLRRCGFEMFRRKLVFDFPYVSVTHPI